MPRVVIDGIRLSLPGSVMACLHERFSSYLLPVTVTGDDGRQQPDTRNDVAEAVG